MKSVDLLDGLDRIEKFGAVAVARALGARAEAHDVRGRQGAHDCWLVFPDGRRAALEVTSHSGDGVRERDALLDRSDNEWPTIGSWVWTMNVPAQVRLQDLEARYQTVILWCERTGRSDLRGLYPFMTELPDEVRWMIASGCEAWAFREVGERPPKVYVLPTGFGGVVDEQLQGLASELERILDLPNQRRHLEKLMRTTADERHLFIAFGDGGMAVEQTMGLGNRVESIACEPPLLPSGLTGLWFVGYYSHTLVGVSEGQWVLHALGDLRDWSKEEKTS